MAQRIMNKETYQAGTGASSSYEAGYRIFLRRCNFRDAVISGVKDHISTQTLRNKGPLRVLDFGCGDGAMTLRYLNALGPGNVAQVTLIEPAPASLSDASEKIKKEVFSVEGHAVTAETFLEANKTEPALWDWIICSYCFYHVHVRRLKDMLSLLTDQGFLMIAMGGLNHPLRSHPSLNGISKHGDIGNLSDVMRELNSRYEITEERIPTEIDVNDLIDTDGALNEEGRLFFSFLFNINFEDFTTEQLEAIVGIVKKLVSQDQGIVRHHHILFWLWPK